MKKISALVLIFVLILSSLQIFAQNAENGDSTDEKNTVKTMIVLGDSISTGYGLDGYESGAPNSGISSYANITVEHYGLVRDESYFNYARDGATSKGILDDLNGAYGEEKLNNIKNADTVVITVGGNDILLTLLPEVSKILGLEENALPADIVLALVKMENDKIGDFEKNAKDFCKENKKLSELYANYSQNLDDILKKLEELAPSAQIFALNIYDPLRDMPSYSTVTALDENIVSAVLSEINKALAEVCERNGIHIVDIDSEFLGRRQACTNVGKFDIHPNLQGHSIISDALCTEIDRVYDELSGKNDTLFEEPKYVWFYFAGAVAIVTLSLPIVIWFSKKTVK